MGSLTAWHVCGLDTKIWQNLYYMIARKNIQTKKGFIG